MAQDANLILDHAAGAEVSVSMRDAGPGHREEPAELPTGLGDGTPAWDFTIAADDLAARVQRTNLLVQERAIQ